MFSSETALTGFGYAAGHNSACGMNASSACWVSNLERGQRIMFAGEKCNWLTRAIKKSVQTEFDPATRYVGAITISVLGLLCAVHLRSITGMFGVPITLLTTVIAAMFGGL